MLMNAPEPYPWDLTDLPAELPPPDPDAIPVHRGRRAPFSQVADWVLLAPIPDGAARLYWLLVAHLNTRRNDGRCWPMMADIADALGCSVDTVKRNLKALRELGAVDVREWRYGGGMRRRNVYIVHETPPPGYQGRLSVEDVYSAPNSVKPQVDTEGAKMPPPEVADISPPEVARMHSQKPYERETRRKRNQTNSSSSSDLDHRNATQDHNKNHDHSDDHRNHLPTATTQSVKTLGRPLTRQDHTVAELRKLESDDSVATPAPASRACAAAPFASSGLAPEYPPQPAAHHGDRS